MIRRIRGAVRSVLVPALCALGAVSCARRGAVVVVRSHAPVSVLSALAAVAPAPGKPPAPAAPWGAAGRAVTVRPGDSLWTLARRNLGTGFAWRRLARANGIARPWVLAVGRRLVVPARVWAGRRDPAFGTRSLHEKRYGWKPVANRAYRVGEKLTFAVQYAGMTAGYATLSIPEIVGKGGRPTYHIVARATSQPFFNAFFHVEDILDSYQDVDYAFSWGYAKRLCEGGFRAQASYDYDQRKGEILEPAKGTRAPMPIGSEDVLSCFYYLRTQPLAVGDTVRISVTADDMKTYQLSVDVLRRERVHALAGDFDCLVLQPHLEFQGVLRQRGQVLLWISDDRRRLPVLIRSRIVIGSIDINLQNAQWIDPREGTGHEEKKE